METGYYYGIFNYSPNNKNPKLYTEGHWRWESLQHELKTKREYHDKQIARVMAEEKKGPKHAEYVEFLEKEYRDEVFNMMVNVEKERVFIFLMKISTCYSKPKRCLSRAIGHL